jgi:hypothetical protein
MERQTVTVGQIWADNDKRCAGRRLRIVSIDQDRGYAYARTLAGNHERGSPVRIRLYRFIPNSRGYRLIR